MTNSFDDKVNILIPIDDSKKQGKSSRIRNARTVMTRFRYLGLNGG